MTATIPEAVLARFRALSFERLQRVDAGWTALVAGECSVDQEKALYRDLHTLKGDARVVGLGDVAVLCQKLEDLLFAARDRRYRVHEDVDVVATMAIQFIGMLLRKRRASGRSAIDLEGFIKQIEEVLSEWLRRSSETPELERSGPVRLVEAGLGLEPLARRRLSSVATTIYLEHLRARGASRERLHGAWAALVDELASLDASPLGPTLTRHGAAGKQLARELGKQADVIVRVGEARVSVEVADRLGVALLHAIRNAIDHGIEPPTQRAAGGKPTIGTVRVDARTFERQVEVTVRDDGAGIDFERVRARAVEEGLLSEADAPGASKEALLELLFTPGFSTRRFTTEVSGRGIGLDAVRTALAEVGGEVTIGSRSGQGTTLILRVPQAHRVTNGTAFPAPAHDLTLAVDDSWVVEAVDDRGGIDPLEAFGLGDIDRASRTGQTGVRVRRGPSETLFRAGGPPRPVRIVRVCATAPEEPLEVVALDGMDAILLRPEALRA